MLVPVACTLSAGRRARPSQAAPDRKVDIEGYPVCTSRVYVLSTNWKRRRREIGEAREVK